MVVKMTLNIIGESTKVKWHKDRNKNDSEQRRILMATNEEEWART